MAVCNDMVLFVIVERVISSNAVTILSRMDISSMRLASLSTIASSSIKVRRFPVFHYAVRAFDGLNAVSFVGSSHCFMVSYFWF